VRRNEILVRAFEATTCASLDARAAAPALNQRHSHGDRTSHTLGGCRETLYV